MTYSWLTHTTRCCAIVFPHRASTVCNQAALPWAALYFFIEGDCYFFLIYVDCAPLPHPLPHCKTNLIKVWPYEICASLPCCDLMILISIDYYYFFTPRLKLCVIIMWVKQFCHSKKPLLFQADQSLWCTQHYPVVSACWYHSRLERSVSAVTNIRFLIVLSMRN